MPSAPTLETVHPPSVAAKRHLTRALRTKTRAVLYVRAGRSVPLRGMPFFRQGRHLCAQWATELMRTNSRRSEVPQGQSRAGPSSGASRHRSGTSWACSAIRHHPRSWASTSARASFAAPAGALRVSGSRTGKSIRSACTQAMRLDPVGKLLSESPLSPAGEATTARVQLKEVEGSRLRSERHAYPGPDTAAEAHRVLIWQQ